jgi:hypothetical protein
LFEPDGIIRRLGNRGKTKASSRPLRRLIGTTNQLVGNRRGLRKFFSTFEARGRSLSVVPGSASAVALGLALPQMAQAGLVTIPIRRRLTRKAKGFQRAGFFVRLAAIFLLCS